MNILILGSGGREHTFAWKINQSSQCSQLYVSPGNAGTEKFAKNVDLNGFEQIAQFIKSEKIDMLVVGPEGPLVDGVIDFFKGKKGFSKLLLIGPESAGAKLEGSKDFSKAFMEKYSIPTAGAKTFTKDTMAEGLKYLEESPPPFVLKADGLAAGKGVIITSSLEEAKEELTQMLAGGKFGAAAAKVLIEEFLTGIELSVFVLCDGKNYVILPEAKDYKRIGENDQGLNTGGMGAVSPVPFANKDFLEKVEKKVVKPTLKGLQKEGIHYVGFLFIGLMNSKGEPKVIEYNVRMGDPETQVVLPRIKTDLVRLLKSAAKGSLDKIKLKISPKFAVTTVVVAGGYPESYEKGDEISLPQIEKDGYIFHAGTFRKKSTTVTNGGRVLALTGMAKTLNSARKKSQALAKKVKFKNKYFRKDIGKDLLSS